MTIPINLGVAGVGKRSNARGPKKIDNIPRIAREDGIVPVSDLAQVIGTSDEQPHRPWLVPGAGRL